MDRAAKIYIAGHRGLIGGAVLRRLQDHGFTNLLTRTRHELDLTNQAAVEDFFQTAKPAYVVMAAAKVGGIFANKTHPGDFIRENLDIQTNTITSAWRHGCRKFLFLGSVCIFPKEAPVPVREESLLTGPLEVTNQAYAVSKIAGIMLGQSLRQQYGWDFIAAQPANLYGIGDNFHPEHAHVIPGVMVRMHAAKLANDPIFSIWGTGKPMREFLNADDCADALHLLLDRYSETQIINVGTGQDITIGDLAILIAEIVGYTGRLVFDASKPDGTYRRVMDVSRLKALGWRPRVSLKQGIEKMYAWYLANQEIVRAA